MNVRLAPVVFAFGCAASVAKPPPQPPAPVPVAPPEPSEPTGIPAGYVDMHAAEVVALPEGAALLIEDDHSHLVIPIYIGGTEGASIDLRMRGQQAPRPLTHDLLDHVIRELHGSLVKVQIDALHDDTYFGSIFLRDGHRVVRLDARPSDAIALAIGNRVPIYVARAVLDEVGVERDVIKQRLVGPSQPTT